MLIEFLVALLLFTTTPIQQPAFRAHTVYYFSESGEPTQAHHNALADCSDYTQDFQAYESQPQSEVTRRKKPVVIRFEDTNEVVRKSPLLR